MSPRGDPESARPRSMHSADRLGAPRGEADDATAAEVLPLRLSIARGGIGIELVSPQQLGPLVCEHLDAILLGVSYPVDLSKGVKQFRGRRSELRGATVLVDLYDLGALWAPFVEEIWGEPVSIHISAGALARDVLVRSEPKSANQNDQLECVCVCVHSEIGALAFDLVVASGREPRLIVDCPRSVGQLPFLTSRSSMQAALQVLDAGLRGSSAVVEMTRVGRSVVVSGLAHAICLALLPQFGFRLPQVGRHAIVEIGVSLGKLRCVLSQLTEPFQASLHALSVATVADFLRRADDALSDERIDEARVQYLQALENAPGHPSVLIEIADLDLATGVRAESALTFLEERRADDGSANGQRVRYEILSARAMDHTGRNLAGYELWSAALESEHNPIVFAQLACALAKRTSEVTRVRELLDRAVTKAPLVRSARWARLELALKQGEVRMACTDAEQLEAGLTDLPSRGRLLLQLSILFREHGLEDEALRFLRRALGLVPEDPEVMILLAERLNEAAETVRAGELLTAALRILTEPLRSLSMDRNKQTELVQRCHYMLAQIFSAVPNLLTDALLHLGAVSTRSTWGPRARIEEFQIFHQLGNTRDRDHALARLVEAFKLGWIDIQESRQHLTQMLERLDPPLETSTQTFIFDELLSTASEK